MACHQAGGEGRTGLFEALKRGLDFNRDPGTKSIHPYPQTIGSLNTFAALQDAGMILHAPGQTPAPNVLMGVGQYGILPKYTGG